MEDLEQHLKNFKLEIKYKKNLKRLNLRLKSEDVIYITSPHHLKKDQILKFVYEKSGWILKRHQEMQNQAKLQSLNWSHLSFIPFRGENWTLIVERGPRQIVLDELQKHIIFQASEVIIQQPEKIKKILLSWLQENSLRILHEKVRYYEPLIGVRSKSIQIKNYRSRWGACNSKAELFFNWQIIAFSEHLMDYVVAHELCHIKEMNHSPRFYQLLEQQGFNIKEVHDLMKLKTNIYLG